MAAAPPGPVLCIRRDTGLSRDDLYRILPAFLAGRPYAVDPDGAITTAIGDGRVVIRPGPQTERRLGMLRLPAMVLDFEFSACTNGEQDAFLTAFENAYRRGGG